MTLTLPLPSHPGEPLHYGQLYGSSLPLALANTIRASTDSWLIVCEDTLSAQRVEQALLFFLADTQRQIVSFPDWETLPYDNFSPHQDIISQRILTLYQLLQTPATVLVVPVSTLMHYIATPEFIGQSSFYLRVGDTLKIEVLREQLAKRGYRCVNQVYEHGEFAIRGSIVDIFPMGCDEPFRIDLFDDEVETIRPFDPETQLSRDKIPHIHLLPALEFPFDEKGISTFRQHWREKFSGNPQLCPIYQNTSEGLLTGGIEYYLPLFFTQPGTLLQFLSENTVVARVGNITQAAEQFWQEATQRYTQCNIDRTKPLLAPELLFLRHDVLFGDIKRFKQMQLQHLPLDNPRGTKVNLPTDIPPVLPVNHRVQQPLSELQYFLNHYTGRILFCAESAGRRESLNTLLQTISLIPPLANDWHDFLAHNSLYMMTIAPLEEGLALPTENITLITESQLFGAQVLQARRRKSKRVDPELAIRNLAELTIGAPIVHVEHGVGRFLGLQVIHSGEVEGEYLTIEYAGNDKLYVPVAALHMIGRYSGMDSEHAPLHRLGTSHWQKAREKAAEEVRDVAAELLALYAKRAAREGFAFRSPDSDYQRFAAGFPFEETPDQHAAIEAVIQDMQAGKPMDRLVCGDVGFGKTEVAMRAAFVAVQSGKQVVILVPTTLLAQQHYENFKDRFAEWPVNIESLSRFQTSKQQHQIIHNMQEGKVDIVIGTHKLLNEKIRFNELGLLIIDEEHRFGVHQKEKLKQLRAEVDILTLTATPIPRTLNMAVSGLRELSIIATPPAKRLSIKTFVHQRSRGIMREAILREILRGGQVYFLHNSVDTIELTAQEIQTLLPEARVHVAHGQMRERELERIMSDFYHQRFNVLVCTTIIETGIDIPTANTIIIDRADKFGLAQLHQLRGRVGRSHHQAYAYLMTPVETALTKDAQKRLDAISAFDELGLGFTLATHDLEIRGAGELLGDNQSGNIQAIGFSLYMDMLEKAVESIKAGKIFSLDQHTADNIDVDLKISALLPSAYVGDVHERLTLYKRIASAKNAEELEEVKVELIDRFGTLPAAAKNLFGITDIKLLAKQLGIRKIEAHLLGGRCEFHQQNNVDPVKIIQLIQKQAARYQLDGPNRLKFKIASDTADKRIQCVKSVLGELFG